MNDIVSKTLVNAAVRVLCYIAVFAVFRMYRVLWKYADSFQLFKQGLAVIVAFGVTFGVNFVYERARGSQALSNNFLIHIHNTGQGCQSFTLACSNVNGKLFHIVLKERQNHFLRTTCNTSVRITT